MKIDETCYDRSTAISGDIPTAAPFENTEAWKQARQICVQWDIALLVGYYRGLDYYVYVMLYYMPDLLGTLIYHFLNGIPIEGMGTPSIRHADMGRQVTSGRHR